GLMQAAAARDAVCASAALVPVGRALQARIIPRPEIIAASEPILHCTAVTTSLASRSACPGVAYPAGPA
ncbi:hypothetical protein, partial [Sphingosinicella sp.]|uniref:hypothetical protein n=1 Tax=Sphingosinicella sp. TaxID=1917971 RepID=UPI0040381DFC